MAFTELPDGEHTVNGKSFTKNGNAFTFDGKTLNAKEIEKATRTTSEKMRKTVDETVSDAEIGNTPKTEAAKSEVSDKSDKKETSVPSVEKSVPEKTDSTGNTVLFSKQGDLQQNIEEVNQKFNDDLDRQIAGTLPKGYIHQLGTPGNILLSTGVPNLPIELSATRLEEKSKQDNHPFDISTVKNLPVALQKPVGVFSYPDPSVINVIVEIQKDGKNFLVGLYINSTYRGIAVNNIRTLFPKDLHEWLFWIDEGRTLYLDKEKVQNLIAQQRRNLADVNNLDLNFINNIIQNFENPSVSSKNPENSSGGAKFSMSGDLDLGDTSLSPEDYRRSIDQLFDFVMEYTDGVVNPGSGHIGEEFTGSYISPEYKEYSVKRKQGAKESDASYQRYLARREESLKFKKDRLPGGPIPDRNLPIDHPSRHPMSTAKCAYPTWLKYCGNGWKDKNCVQNSRSVP